MQRRRKVRYNKKKCLAFDLEKQLETLYGQNSCFTMSESSRFIHRYVEKYCTEDTTDLTFCANNCPGQNRNKCIFLMPVLLINLKKLRSVKLAFLEKGHTQKENDTVHSVSENNEVGHEIMHPVQWKTLIENACKVRPYIVESVNKKKFKNFEVDNKIHTFLVKWSKDTVFNEEEGFVVKN